MKTIKIKDCMGRGYSFIDVRTPKEFNEDTIPGAVNIPLFSDEERAIIGKLYTKKGREEAIIKGMGFVAKRLPKIYSKIRTLKQPMAMFCWRGGMRSKSLVNLLSSIGYDIYQLEGGYKAYRQYVRERLKNYKIKPIVVVLQGKTGSGKTEILRNFKNSVDLEGMAQHRGSLFGGINLKPNSQKKFESLLLKRLDELQNEKWILIEGEAKKIGHIHLPEFLVKAIKLGKQILIERPIEERAKRLVEEYFDATDKNIKELKDTVQFLKKMIGKKMVEKIIKMIDNKEYVQAAVILLEKHYDPKYEHAAKGIKYDLIIKEDYIKKIKNFGISLT